MTEQQTPTTARGATIPRQRSENGAAPLAASGPGMGWVRFGGVMMAVIGAFGVIEGLAALLSPTYFVTVNGSVLAFNLTGWGWLHVILGALVLITGLSLLNNAPTWARWVGVGLIAINMLVQLTWLPAYPIWSIIMLALDVMVVVALIATQSEGAEA